MGETVESSRIALEQEISRWNGFGRALRKEDGEAFEELMGMCRSFALESSNVTSPAVFESMVMPILLAQQKKLQNFHYKLYEVLWQIVCAHERQLQSQKQASSPG
jgi:predicted NACHT family NTPase